MANLRLFLAVEIEPHVLDRLEEAQVTLRATYVNFRWLPRGSMHLTMKFLGGIPEEQLAALTTRIQPLVASIPACEVELSHVSAFPSWHRVNVVVAECRAPAPLGLLYERLQPAFIEMGVPAEKRPFRPHVTLARPRDRRAAGKLAPADVQFAGLRWNVRNLVLFQSHLGTGGARYEPLRHWPLAGTEPTGE